MKVDIIQVCHYFKQMSDTDTVSPWVNYLFTKWYLILRQHQSTYPGCLTFSIPLPEDGCVDLGLSYEFIQAYIVSRCNGLASTLSMVLIEIKSLYSVLFADVKEVGIESL